MSGSSTKIWQPRQTIDESFTALVDQYPDKEIFVFYNKGTRDPYTVTTLYTLAGRFADRLRRYGFQKQDIIANTLPNCPERIVTDLGIIFAGCVPMKITMDEICITACKSKCKCIIMSDFDQSPTWILLQSKLCFHLAATVIIVYGSTECFRISKSYVDEKSFQSYNCGKYFDLCDVRVADGENKPCPPNVTGTIHVKDDYGYIDDAGKLFVLGRIKDVINYGSSAIYPCWMEEMVTEHQDVIQTCVVPVSDPVLHQNICACIKLSTSSISGAEDIRSYCEHMFLLNTHEAHTPKPGFHMSDVSVLTRTESTLFCLLC
ncbi:hypothetical protein Btru_022985 [Bulinus truncatus]|nr:hypothetical protein Btru_022985 [Bulinus truncatus]